MEAAVHATTLSTVRVGEIAVEASPRRWLIEGLWGARAVGMIGGCPKIGKSWLGLDMAVSVATGTPCLGRFPVREPGPVLVYLAEDALPTLRQRVASLAGNRGLDVSRIDVHVITEPTLRLDRPCDRVRLHATVARLRPHLVLLDPLVRLHAANENDATEIAELLSYFRDLQRKANTAVALVHHTRKNATGAQAGQSLRGSSDFWAWSDSALYLRRIKDQVVLSMEHRAAAPPDPVNLRLVTTDEATIHLEVIGAADSQRLARDEELQRAVLEALTHASVITRGRLRERLAVKNERLGRVLTSLEQQHAIERIDQGWRLTAKRGSNSVVPRSPL